MNILNNDIYLLYKKIFGNIFLSGLVFKFVKEINVEIILSNRFSGFPIEDPRRKYNEITFEWIVRNKEYSILFDFYKSINIDQQNKKVVSNSIVYEIPIIELQNNIISFLIDINSKFNNNNKNNNNNYNYNNNNNSNNNQELFKEFLYKFYIINKNNLNQIKVEKVVINGTTTEIQQLDLLEVAVFCSNFQFLMIVYQEYYKNLDCSKLRLDRVLNFSISNGDINILKFLYNTLGCRIYDKNLAIKNCFQSNNFNDILKFLIYEIKYPTHQSTLDLTNLEIFKFLQIDNDLFSQFWNISPLSFDFSYFKVESIPIKNLYNLIQNHFSPRWKDLSFSKHLDFIYNFDSNDGNFDTNTIYNFINKKEFKQLFQNENTIINGIKSNFQKSKNNQNKQPQQQQQLASRLDILKFKEFTTEREIKRLFICYFLIDYRCLLNVTQFLEFIVKFIDDYKEYNLFSQLLDQNQCFFYNSQNDQINNNNNNNINNYIGNPIKAFHIVSVKYPNVFIYLFRNHYNNFNWDNKNITSLAIENNNLELLKFMYNNSMPIKSEILDTTNCDNIEIIKFLLSKNIKFSKASLYNCVKHKRINLLEFYLSNLSPPENNTIGNEPIGPIITKFLNTENVKVLLNSPIINKFIDDKSFFPYPPYLN
ncbi:hypothetical protein ACTFIU_002936 [Dictyostelium citrinum]